MISCVGRLCKHLFSIIADSSGGRKCVGEGILFCAWGFWYFLYVGGKGGRNLAEKEAEKNKFLLQTNCL